MTDGIETTDEAGLVELDESAATATTDSGLPIRAIVGSGAILVLVLVVLAIAMTALIARRR